jgi:hypothetical protein
VDSVDFSTRAFFFRANLRTTGDNEKFYKRRCPFSSADRPVGFRHICMTVKALYPISNVGAGPGGMT